MIVEETHLKQVAAEKIVGKLTITDNAVTVLDVTGKANPLKKVIDQFTVGVDVEAGHVYVFSVMDGKVHHYPIIDHPVHGLTMVQHMSEPWFSTVAPRLKFPHDPFDAR